MFQCRTCKVQQLMIFLDHNEKGIYDHVSEAMDRAFNDCALLPVQQERVLKAIAYSIDDGEMN